MPGDRFVASIQNHDQVGNRARGERLAALVGWPERRLAASLLLLAPHVPMLFMGEEYGEENPFLFFCSFGNGRLIEAVRQGRRREYHLQGEPPDPQAESSFAASRLSWSWPDGSPRMGLRRLYADLLAARRDWPGLRDFSRRSARLLPDARNGPILELVRGPEQSMDTVRAYFNLTAEPQPLGAPAGQAVLFSSEEARYGGDRRHGSSLDELRGYECLVFGVAARLGHGNS